LSGMSLVGKVESLWRYPVKSMRGEELQEAFVGFSGVYGDRLFAFKSSAAPKGIPLPDRAGAGRDAAVSPSLSPSGKSRKTS
jgi:MOSC N-terminal beta barrel domain